MNVAGGKECPKAMLENRILHRRDYSKPKSNSRSPAPRFQNVARQYLISKDFPVLLCSCKFCNTSTWLHASFSLRALAWRRRQMPCQSKVKLISIIS